MNTLTLIKKQIEKQFLLLCMMLRFLTLPIVVLSMISVVSNKESHGTYCYRGRTYTK